MFVRNQYYVLMKCDTSVWFRLKSKARLVDIFRVSFMPPVLPSITELFTYIKSYHLHFLARMTRNLVNSISKNALEESRKL
jgi:hypothetical protein